MNLKHIFNEIEKVDPEVYERLDTRRSAMKQFSGIAGKLALAAVPLALGGMFKKAYGQSGTSLFNILNYALTLEYLEAKFYANALAAASAGNLAIPAGAPTTAIQTIGAHEAAHVAFLKQAITAAGGTPVAEPTFDFSAGNGSNNGPFAAVFTNYALFLAVAQVFEDTGVRAYKGQAAEPALMANNDVLTAALNIHSVEARHASHIRQMRKANGGLVPAGVNVKPWITLKQSGIDSAAVQASYDGEEVTTQATIQIVNINNQTISASAASEAFDEPLTMTQVLGIVDPFIV
ncbi:MAG: dessication-associated protein [Citrobacter freundii]|nr:MAG: dessication-associated protein [Citrobacter freundii]